MINPPGSREPESPSDIENRALTAHALACLSQREHSRSELRRKLLQHSLSQPGEADSNKTSLVTRVEAVLDWLEQHCFLSQHRFIESRVRSRAQRYGNVRIRQELNQHGLALPAAAALALTESEFERAYAVWERKFACNSISPTRGPAAQAKQARFLAGRGFSSETIYRVLRAAREGRPSSPTDVAKRDREPGTVVQLRRIGLLK